MTTNSVMQDGCDTLPKLFLKKTAERGNRVAMREKDFGIWQSYTWNDYRARACEIANGLLSLGLQRGDVVSIQSEDCREWLWADIGTLLAGGVVNGRRFRFNTLRCGTDKTDRSPFVSFVSSLYRGFRLRGRARRAALGTGDISPLSGISWLPSQPP